MIKNCRLCNKPDHTSAMYRDADSSYRCLSCFFSNEKESNDKVNAPRHYEGNGMQAIDIIEAFNLNFNLGNAMKYILRAGKKDDFVQDIEKAVWYLQRELEKVKG